MDKAFIYGKSVAGENFTDRVAERKRLKTNFENGINVILVSPRRMGKSSIVRKVRSDMDNPDVKVIIMDIYDCRNEYDFYNRFAATIIKETSNRTEQILDNIKHFLTRLTPKISFSGEPFSEVSLSLGITPDNYQPEEVLQLPELIATEQGKQIVVCIDEFQQIGEFPNSLNVQKRLRSVWQHQQHVSYCLFGSKKHLMTNLFQNRKMPFYQFGEMLYLEAISTEDWIPFLQSRFKSKGKLLPENLARKICETVENHSSYVQQLAWNVLVETTEEATEENFNNGVQALLAQCSGLFEQQIQGLSSHQMNFLRAISNGIHKEFASVKVSKEYNLGSKSNITRLQTALQSRELVEVRREGTYLEDPVFKIWFRREFPLL